MEEVDPVVEAASPQEKVEEPQVVVDKREEAVPESDVAQEVGVMQVGGSYSETKKGSGLFLWRRKKPTQPEKGRGRRAP